MPTQLKKEIVCPKCSHNHILALKVGIDNSENIEVKEQILNESFFDWTCPNCKYIARMLYPMMYTDLEKKYTIILTPSAGKADNILPTDVIMGMKKRRVKSLAELKEKIVVFDDGLNDIALEITKIALCVSLREKYGTNKIKAYYSKINDDSSINFACFVLRTKQAVYESIAFNVYEQALNLLQTIDFEEDELFLRVGPTLAKELIEKYKNR